MGTEDTWLPASLGRDLADRVEDSRFVTYGGVGHIPMEEAPGRTVADTAAFLRNTRHTAVCDPDRLAVKRSAYYAVGQPAHMDVLDSDSDDTRRSPPDEGATDTDSTTRDERDRGGHDDTGGEDIPEPTPQSAALRRQQQYVGVGGALVAGVAFGVGTLQRFPDTPMLAAFAGLTGTALVLWLVRKSIFPGESAD